ncbi:MAG: hypothetical protein LBR38_07735 [Synergistaceae bacterium]|nr:hypothetical protein [Synergistaceae bacterium]
MKFTLCLLTALLAIAVGFGTPAHAAFGTDIIGRTAVVSFAEMLSALPSPPVADNEAGGWFLTAPDGSTKFFWRRDAEGKRDFDTFIVFDAAPFEMAGLDPNALPSYMKYFTLDGVQKIVIGRKLSSEFPPYEGNVTPVTSFERIPLYDRQLIDYHSALDHYGVSLADGTVFEWAKDMTTNDKDLVFALNPAPFIKAGVDPLNVKGWVFAKVPGTDARGRKVENDKLLKAFDLLLNAFERR